MSSTVLVRLSGRDRPGITAGLMRLLAEAGIDLYDVEQVVVRDRLILGLLVGAPGGLAGLDLVRRFGSEHELQVDLEVVDDAAQATPARAVVTVIGPRIDPEAFGAVAEAIAGAGGNIDRIVRLSRYPVVSYELAVGGGDLSGMRRDLLEASRSHAFDVAVQAEGIERWAKRLAVLDVDSTLIQDEVIELLAAEAGRGAEVRAVTAAAMAGEIDFAEALAARVGLLEGLDELAVERVRRRIRLTPGARTFVRTLKRLGMKIAIVSGGFTLFTDRLRDELELDHAFANRLEVVSGRLTGRLVGPIVDRARKATLLRQVADLEGIPLEQVMAVGDGANDLDMLAAAGLGVAFNAKPLVRAAADTAVTVPYLDAILFLLGIRRDEVEAGSPGTGQGGRVVPIPGLPPV